MDARGRQPYIHLSLHAFIDEPFHQRPLYPLFIKQYRMQPQSDHRRCRACGLVCRFAIDRSGIQPIILERGKDVRARRRDLAAFK